MKPTAAEVDAGQAVYTRNILSAYDLLVLGISNRWIWKCPTPRIEAHYNSQLSANHLDVGVGTGYFLDRCRFPGASPRIALMDLNDNSLAFAANRIARYRPEVWRQNVLEPIQAQIRPFDSIGINYLLHCLPGTIAEKAVVFDHLQPLLKPGARLFGSTILRQGVEPGATARALMSIYNRKGIFSNEADALNDLRGALEKRFARVSIEVIGCVALFSAQN
ncbi:class I SAM-dependent methyltransferase [Marinobacterium nitratireducens]|uniref:class I SAM-dependent methyltransferase n=1 Tax=Marinobacterium nitratireducens TaxID=518897 RepID=UPI001E4423E9|nr:class I SAM-dependent methyltransferase [Marinobacterium nitratireducens]